MWLARHVDFRASGSCPRVSTLGQHGSVVSSLAIIAGSGFLVLVVFGRETVYGRCAGRPAQCLLADPLLRRGLLLGGVGRVECFAGPEGCGDATDHGGSE